MKKLKNILLVFLFLLFATVYSTHILWALEKDTHEFLNKKLARNYSILNNYLKDQLGFSKGIEETFVSGNQGKTVEEWIGIGGKKEDEPAYSRSLNHFHIPLVPWDSSGFKGTSKSSVIWSQEQGSFGSAFGGDWSWKKARDSFYKGLTSLTKTDREKNLADTFRALGQVMHLVEDASVPAHVRNDAHIFGYHYEKWVLQNHGILNLSPFNFDQSILDITPESSAPIPIANIFDTNRYNGSNPNVTFGDSIGLTEYTNANFFSENTIFTDFPYPSWGAIVEYEDIDITGKKRTYLKKLGNGESVGAKTGYGESINHFAAGRRFYKLLPPHLKHLGLKLDEKVYSDYAQKLIPRAVGYSAGLLNYFFRGRMEAGTPEIIYDSFCNITGIKIPYIGNSTYKWEIMANKDAMGPGNFIVSYQYKPYGSGGFVYGVSDEKPLNESIGSSYISSSAFTFNFNNPIPPNALEIKLTLIFKGKLGNEGVYPYNGQFAVAAQALPVINNNCSVTYREYEAFKTVAGNNIERVAFNYFKLNGQYLYEPLPEGQIYICEPPNYGVCHPINISEPDIVITIWCDGYRNLPINRYESTKNIIYDSFHGQFITTVINGQRTVYDAITGENVGNCCANNGEYVYRYSSFEPHCERLTPWEEPPPPP
ncbi:MAG: hypothetical protein HY756_02225 [Nitrospirae bacterium]|nr:hypothetical protein [Nitrospirota bacterium]